MGGGKSKANDGGQPPKIEGVLAIQRRQGDVFIGGDPAGLRSFAKLLAWTADLDQNSLPDVADGERFRLVLSPQNGEGEQPLSPTSSHAEISRLDAKGSGKLPDEFLPKSGGKLDERVSLLGCAVVLILAIVGLMILTGVLR